MMTMTMAATTTMMITMMMIWWFDFKAAIFVIFDTLCTAFQLKPRPARGGNSY